MSELVTNAVLHASAPISVRVRGTRHHPRVEVRDGSTEAPKMPSDESLELDDPESTDFDEDALLVTFGRGLDIVARCSDAWGAEVEENGKVVWFAPALRTKDDGVPGKLTGVLRPSESPGPDAIPFQILEAPLKALTEFERHYRELRREVRLLSLAHEGEYPLAKNLSELFGSLERDLQLGLDDEELQAAQEAGRETVDLTIRLHRESAESMGRFVELLDFADEFVRKERMLSLARSEEQRDFQTWFLTEFVRQQAGEAPRPFDPELSVNLTVSTRSTAGFRQAQPPYRR